MLQTFSILISGRVQGVYYRQSTKQKALKLGITGYVKNLPDGNVQVLASGTAHQLHQLVAWCKQGPPTAAVTSVQVETIAPLAFPGFSIQR